MESYQKIVLRQPGSDCDPENGVEYIIYHAYDTENQGVPTLRIDQLIWDADG
jgi:hypothetical protein